MIAKNTILRIIQQFLQFAISIVIAKQVGVDGNGYFSLFIAEVSLMILLIGVSGESTITYFLAKKKLNVNQVFSLMPSLFLFQLVVFSLIYYFSSYYLNYSIFLSGKSNAGVYWALLFIVSSILINYCSAILFAHKFFESVAISTIIIQLVFLVVFLFCLQGNNHAFPFTFNTVVPVYTSMIVLQALIIFIIVGVKFKSAILPKLPTEILNKEILKYTAIVFSGNIIQFLCYRVDIWFVDYYHGATDVGLYALSTKVAQLWWVLPQILASFFFPLVALEHVTKKMFNKTVVNLLLFSIATAIVAIFLYPVFVHYFVGDAYADSYIAFLYLLPGMILFSINILLAAKFAGDGSVGFNLKVAFLGFVIICILDVCLIPKYGIKGAAIASCIAYSCSSIFAIIKYKKEGVV